jgi:hypothetical protein
VPFIYPPREFHAACLVIARFICFTKPRTQSRDFGKSESAGTIGTDQRSSLPLPEPQLSGLLVNLTSVVTGAGQGLGRAIAAEMASQGPHVVLIDRNQLTVEEATAAIRDFRGAAEGHDMSLAPDLLLGQ